MEISVGRLIINIIQWTIAIAAVLGTLGLFTWIAILFFKKDPR